MYNGIGIKTARGTGTNGYVQKNLSYVPPKRERVEYVKDAEIKKLETLIEKKGNTEILAHERKRRIEVKCMEMREMMLNNGYDEDVTNKKVDIFRKTLIEREGLSDQADIEYDEFGRPIANETHQLAQANDEKNRKLREAFGIGEYDKKKINEQSAQEQKEAERRKVELANRKYTIVQENDDDDDKEEDPVEKEPPKAEKEKKKDKEDRHHHKSRDEKKKRRTSPEPSKERSSQNKSKKHRQNHSDDDDNDKHEQERRSSKHRHRHRHRSPSN